MLNISALNLDFRQLNEQIKATDEDVHIAHCYGQRFIGSGLKGRSITIAGTPGNAMGAYMDGGTITVHGNAQDAIGDTMNDGRIVIHGNAGDALGYSMRGGAIFIRGNAGYRAGIHMKEYRDKIPVIIIGGHTGSFLGEYLAGGRIVVLGIESGSFPVGDFTGTGMHGGKIYIRTDTKPADLPAQVVVQVASAEDMEEIMPYLLEFSRHFGLDAHALAQDRFYVLRPNARNPYKQLYTAS